MRVQLAAGVGLLQEVDVLLGKVQRRLDQHAQLARCARAGLDLPRERAAERAAGRARGGFGAGVDQVGHRLGLGQVELAVEKGALGELARLGQAQARSPAPACRQRASSSCSTHRAAMGLQLEHVFAGVGVRRREVQRQALVDGAAVGAQEGQQRGLARRQRRGRTARATSGCRSRPGDAHDADRAAARRGGDGDDGQGAARQHGGIVAWRSRLPGAAPGAEDGAGERRAALGRPG